MLDITGLRVVDSQGSIRGGTQRIDDHNCSYKLPDRVRSNPLERTQHPDQTFQTF
jgi:hypothetical protein